MQPIRALGFMTGTSMDGVDAAILVTDGQDHIEFGPTASIPYDDKTRADLLAARGWDAPDTLHQLVEDWHGPDRFAPEFRDVELIGFHGQTLAHDPAAGRTLQAGDGARLARAWERPVVWDFRRPDMGAGGQGAPLAPFFHFHALRGKGLCGRVAVVNIGGVANVTFADLNRKAPDDDGALLAFDTGPGNALIDDFMARHRGVRFDQNGAFAAAGAPDAAIVAAVLDHDYFARTPPKSLDRDDFSDLMPDLAHLAPADAAATLTRITTAAIAAALTHAPHPPARWLVTGGGRHNSLMMDQLRADLAAPVDPIEAVGLDGDALEAQAFAWLAVRVLRGLPTSAPGTTGCRNPVCGGTISRP